MHRPGQIATLLLLTALGPWGNALAGVELTLDDGRVFKGIDIELKKDEGLYVLEFEDDEFLPIPFELVAKMRLTGGDAPAPTGINVTSAKTLVGPEDFELPTRSELRRVLQPSTSSFRPNVINPFWKPTSDWDMSPSRNNFNPARWFEAPIPFEWTPVSGFTADGDVTQFNPARWYEAPIDPTWYPTDGFRKE